MDVHKKMLAVVVAQVDGNRIEYLSERFGTTRQDLDQLAHWLHQQPVTEVAMESTAQSWMPVWLALEEQFTLYLAQPRSTAAPQGRKSDWADAQPIVRRLLAQDLTLSYVPGREQREWRTMTRTRVEMSAQRFGGAIRGKGFWSRRRSSCPACSATYWSERTAHS